MAVKESNILATLQRAFGTVRVATCTSACASKRIGKFELEDKSTVFAECRAITGIPTGAEAYIYSKDPGHLAAISEQHVYHTGRYDGACHTTTSTRAKGKFRLTSFPGQPVIEAWWFGEDSCTANDAVLLVSFGIADDERGFVDRAEWHAVPLSRRGEL